MTKHTSNLGDVAFRNDQMTGKIIDFSVFLLPLIQIPIRTAKIAEKGCFQECRDALFLISMMIFIVSGRERKIGANIVLSKGG